MNSLSISRILKLIKFEFLMHRRYYLMILIGAFVLVTSYLTYSLSYFKIDMVQYGMKNNFYNRAYFFYVIAILLFVVGQSFIDLRSKASAERYLLLPALPSEKLFSQFIVKFTLAFLVMPIIFALSAILARWIALEFLIPFTGGITNIDIIDFDVLIPIKQSADWLYYIFILSLILFIPSALFAGSQYYGKWNIVMLPLFMIVFSVVTALSPFIISNLFNDGYKNIGYFLDSKWDIKVFGNEAPLMIYVLLVLFYMGAVLSYIISYHKLKEREV
ncbi:hypothetical protein [Belliella pelovolcani]|uniref:ABC-2 type transport system permease protein n=1 Tax=Belliella pelovolcani TaxID=529505 RepID=A0A1N7N076_9BACT|nr:hypothetical protein [Belliella pelovolcani]SIS91519.1 hypothetical protein SAMN05421761_10819 [Belliella pelovolcani]